jgi:hypothetical protein
VVTSVTGAVGVEGADVGTVVLDETLTDDVAGERWPIARAAPVVAVTAMVPATSQLAIP